MKGLNKVYMIGILVRDPSGPDTFDGAVRAEVSVPRPQLVNGEWQETVETYPMVARSDVAIYLARYAHAGDSVAVECTVRNVGILVLEVERVLWLKNVKASMAGPGGVSNIVPDNEIPF